MNTNDLPKLTDRLETLRQDMTSQINNKQDMAQNTIRSALSELVEGPLSEILTSLEFQKLLHGEVDRLFDDLKTERVKLLDEPSLPRTNNFKPLVDSEGEFLIVSDLVAINEIEDIFSSLSLANPPRAIPFSREKHHDSLLIYNREFLEKLSSEDKEVLRFVKDYNGIEEVVCGFRGIAFYKANILRIVEIKPNNDNVLL